MEKTITIDGKQVTFKTTGALPLRYKRQFGKDFFRELLKMGAVEKLRSLTPENIGNIKSDDLDGLDFEVFFNIAWVMAKTANPSIPDQESWFDSFEVFPMIEIIPELQELIMAAIESKKK